MDVVLIHGMGRTPLSMMRLRRHLRRAGHNPILFGYSPTFETLQGATGRLVRLIERRADTAQYALVGHSLGTVILRSALGRLENRMPAACFFLAPPMVACKAAKCFSRFWLYKAVTGEMGRLLAADEFMRKLPLPPTLVRIYAGVGGPRASWLPFGREANDGILSVSEATGDNAAAAVRVPSLHTFIMNSAPVFDDIASALATLAPPARSRRAPHQETAMEPRISLITLGVADLERATRFYAECLGLPRLETPPSITFFELGKTWLALWSRESLAADAGLAPEGSGFRGFALAHNVRSPAEVDALLARVAACGGTVTKAGQPTDWGGYSGYFTDPDGFVWEVAHNPDFPHV